MRFLQQRWFYQLNVPNYLKFVSWAILELLSFNAQKFTESRNPLHMPIFRKKFLGPRGDCPCEQAGQIWSPKLLAFNSQIVRGHMTLAMPPLALFWHSGVDGHKGTLFEVWTAIIGPHVTSLVFQHSHWKCIGGKIGDSLIGFSPQRKGSFVSGSRRQCQISSKSVQNCDRDCIRARTHRHTHTQSDDYFISAVHYVHLAKR